MLNEILLVHNGYVLASAQSASALVNALQCNFGFTF